jgi:hypothetical protein
MAVLSKSSRAWLERKGIYPSYPRPTPLFDPTLHLIHTEPLSRPHPLPELSEAAQGEPPPDRGATQPWPPGS